MLRKADQRTVCRLCDLIEKRSNLGRLGRQMFKCLTFVSTPRISLHSGLVLIRGRGFSMTKVV